MSSCKLAKRSSEGGRRESDVSQNLDDVGEKAICYLTEISASPKHFFMLNVPQSHMPHARHAHLRLNKSHPVLRLLHLPIRVHGNFYGQCMYAIRGDCNHHGRARHGDIQCFEALPWSPGPRFPFEKPRHHRRCQLRIGRFRHKKQHHKYHKWHCLVDDV